MTSDNSISQETLERTTETIEDAVDSLSYPDSVKTTGLSIYRQSYEKELYHGRRYEVLLGAIVYLSGRILASESDETTVRSPSQVANAIGCDEDELKSASRHLTKRLSLPIPPADPTQFIDQFCDELPVGSEFKETAHEILECCKDNDVHTRGRSPTGVAAGAVYAAAKELDEDVTQSSIADVSGVTEVTIRNYYPDQLELYRDSTE